MTYGPYQARVVDVHDGDTVHLDIDLGFTAIAAAYSLQGKPQLACRIFGINAPELSTPEGKVACEYAKTLLHPGDLVTVVSHGWDKYGGRFDGTVTLSDGRDFATEMLVTKHAIPL